MDIREKIQALMAKALSAGATDEEADAFLTKAQELMAKHGLTEADLESVDSEDNWRKYECHATERKNGRYAWHPVERTLTGVIAKFTGCFSYVSRVPQEAPMKVFYGLEQEVELANWILAGLREKFDRDWSNYKYLDRGRKSFKNLATERKSFTEGFAFEIKRRVDGFHKRTANTTGTALVVQKQELAFNRLREQGMSFGGASAANFGYSYSGEAAGAGKASAASADLGRGVAHNSIRIGHSPT